jgi:NADPH:quinone reductase-like Zn-dependent oxidoreductase
MRAVIYEQYGGPEVLQVRDVPKPQPKENEVLIRVRAFTATSGDWRVRSLQVPRGFGWISRLVFGVSRPRQPILGTELSGVIEEVGSKVQKFKVGDEVFVFSGAKMGCYVEYKCLPEDGMIALKPSNITFEEAAALCFGGTTALDFLRRANIKSGDKVLINGAAGCVGTALIQIAKHFGAHITAVCSAKNRELVTSLGADRVIDYTQEDFTRSSDTYDIIADVVGTTPFSKCKASLKEGGRFLAILADITALLQAPWVSLTTNKKVIAGPSGEKLEDILLLQTLATSGQYKPIISRTFSIEQIAEAHQVIDSGHKQGNIVISLAS